MMFIGLYVHHVDILLDGPVLYMTFCMSKENSVNVL